MRSKTLNIIITIFVLVPMGLLAQGQQPSASAQGQKPSPPTAQPQASPMLPETAKIAYIDLERALSQCGEGQREFGELQKFTEEKSNELRKRQEELDKLKNQLQAQARTLSDDSRMQMQREIDQKEKELNRFREDTQSDIDERRNNALNKIGTKMQGIINSYAKEQGLAMVLVFSQQTVPLYAYLDARYDITNEIIQRYDKTYPVSAAQSQQGQAPSAQPQAPATQPQAPAAQPQGNKPKP